jgi:predicted DNA repair protein MutK
MASGFFAILDDIASLMDDVAVTSKIATQKTAGILGDDLAVNAEKATGFLSSRELPVLWAITKGSFINKLIILPIVFVLNWLYPPAINYVLILGGLYLAFEGVEKIIEFLFHRDKKGHEVVEEVEEKNTNSEETEKAKIKSAITTDFILSIEIVIIALGTVLEESHPFITQILVTSLVAFIATVGVYGIVALIVRMDDAGFKLIRKSNDKGIIGKLGHLLVKALPIVIKALGVIGTIALIMVAGGIFAHRIEYFHHILPSWSSDKMLTVLKEVILGLAGGLLAVAVFTIGKALFSLVKRA